MLQIQSVFDRECAALNTLTARDIPDRSRPYALVRGGRPVSWFATLEQASRHARAHFAPETYAIGDPSAQPDYLPMFMVTHPAG